MCRDKVFINVGVIWWQVQHFLDRGKVGTINKYSAKPDTGTFLNARVVAGWIEFSQNINDWDRVFSIERLVFYLYGIFLAPFMNPGGHIIILPLQFVRETL